MGERRGLDVRIAQQVTNDERIFAGLRGICAADSASWMPSQVIKDLLRFHQASNHAGEVDTLHKVPWRSNLVGVPSFELLVSGSIHFISVPDLRHRSSTKLPSSLPFTVVILLSSRINLLFTSHSLRCLNSSMIHTTRLYVPASSSFGRSTKSDSFSCE